mmetsp:Transcript_11429/g.24112  ORF Transcript_11429/g.24112 Transcript_11429/m.24112 type:complete len:112 (+) Transcript_11429:1939-2274(+)
MRSSLLSTWAAEAEVGTASAGATGVPTGLDAEAAAAPPGDTEEADTADAAARATVATVANVRCIIVIVSSTVVWISNETGGERNRQPKNSTAEKTTDARCESTKPDPRKTT